MSEGRAGTEAQRDFEKARRRIGELVQKRGDGHRSCPHEKPSIPKARPEKLEGRAPGPRPHREGKPSGKSGNWRGAAQILLHIPLTGEERERKGSARPRRILLFLLAFGCSCRRSAFSDGVKVARGRRPC